MRKHKCSELGSTQRNKKFREATGLSVTDGMMKMVGAPVRRVPKKGWHSHLLTQTLRHNIKNFWIQQDFRFLIRNA